MVDVAVVEVATMALTVGVVVTPKVVALAQKVIPLVIPPDRETVPLVIQTPSIPLKQPAESWIPEAKVEVAVMPPV